MKKLQNTVEFINARASADPAGFVRDAEAQFDGVLEAVAQQLSVQARREMVMLAGPSASGKTTTANKLAQSLRARGVQGYVLSLDDFYLSYADIPLDKNGVPDIESVRALDLPLFRKTAAALLRGEEVTLPVYDFYSGGRSETVRTVRLSENDVIIVEGLHALNPEITDSLPPARLYKIYISVSSEIFGANGEILLDQRDLRFIRRMVRDYRFRNSTVHNTYKLWDNVTAGEESYLFPYKDRADVKIDSFHASEPCVFRDIAAALLENADLPECRRAHAERLSAAIQRFVPISPNALSENSLLREFLG